MSDLFSDATAPWWSVPLTGLATLVASSLFNVWINRGQRQSAREESTAAREQSIEEGKAGREHALALLEAEQKSRSEAEKSARQANQAKERHQEGQADSVRAIEAISRMRSAVVLSALGIATDEFGQDINMAQPIERELLDEFVTALARLSLHDDLRVDFDSQLQSLNAYVSAWVVGGPMEEVAHEAPHVTILEDLDWLRNDVAANYRGSRYWETPAQAPPAH